jgi:mycothiol synthase
MPAVAALIKACERADVGENLRSEAHIIAHTRTDRFELTRDAWLIVGRDKEFVGFAWLFETLPAAELEGELYVHPEHRGRGLEEVLLSLLQGRCFAHVPCAASGMVSLAMDCLADDRACRELYERVGFDKVREFRHMEVDLGTTTPASRPRSLPAGVALRDFRSPEDERPVYEALTEAFAEEFRNGEESYAAWRAYGVDRNDTDTSLWVVAARNAEVVGAVISFVEEGVGHISDVGVRRTWRRRGLGSALLTEAFRRLRLRGCTRAWLNVDADNPTGAVATYEGVGMRAVRTYDLFVKELKAGDETGRVEDEAPAR